MTDEEIIKVASDFAEEQGYDPRRYKAVSVVSETVSVHFQGQSGQPGDHFDVRVDVLSGKALELQPGE